MNDENKALLLQSFLILVCITVANLLAWVSTTAGVPSTDSLVRGFGSIIIVITVVGASRRG